MAKQSVADRVWEALEPVAEELGYEIWDVEYLKEGANLVLRVYIDKGSDDEYISTDDCEKVSRFVSDELDRAGLIDKNYYLETHESYGGELRRIFETFEGHAPVSDRQGHLYLCQRDEYGDSMSGLQQTWGRTNL